MDKLLFIIEPHPRYPDRAWVWKEPKLFATPEDEAEDEDDTETIVAIYILDPGAWYLSKRLRTVDPEIETAIRENVDVATDITMQNLQWSSRSDTQAPTGPTLSSQE